MIYPIVIILRELGIYGTLTGLVIVHTIFGMPILTLLFRNYFTSLRKNCSGGPYRRGRFLADLFPHHAAHGSADFCCRHDPAGHRHLERLPVRRRVHPPDSYPMTVQLNNIVNSVRA